MIEDDDKIEVGFKEMAFFVEQGSD